MKIIRWLLGKIILLVETLFAPRGIERSAKEQAKVDQQTMQLALYQFKACPFCVKVRFTMKRLGLNIVTRDAQNNPLHKKELIEQGGQYMVPCLRIVKEDGTAQWLYESTDITRYLTEKFSS
ncbi:MAG: glutathione S-transferase domain-containing protein [Deltaproteobacteria bacterium]|nr:glutathione S-transferase domain-containing protein [Deltaproteobacteria bacterium]MBI2500422.1 glutathione S-transferase domain-containing protein [Deltaproteobacteria bacterium]